MGQSSSRTQPAEPGLSRIEALVAGIPGLISELHLEGVLQQVANLAAEVIGARYSAVGMLSADGRTLETFTTAGLGPQERERIGKAPEGRGVLGLVIQGGQAVRLPDLMKHPASVGFPPHHPPMHSFLGVPIMGKRGVLGDLYLTEKIAEPEFSEEDEHIARLLAAQAAVAIENARLHEEGARLLEEVQRLHRTRERFFAMVNHELRNALSAVFGWAEMLVRRKDPATVPQAAYEVLDSAEQAIALINDLLDLSRLDENRLQTVLRDVDCTSVVRQALSRLTPAADAKNVRLVPQLPAQIPVCRTDPHRVHQILVNLLGNAIRHTPEGSTVRVSLASEASEVTFRVEDEGPGVGSEEVDRIFDVYQTNAGEEGRGSGLGLPLSRRLARLLGGDIEAVARGAGVAGGCFVLRLPAVSL
ncbi:MAG TPA: ATP-binding protein [Gemmatimonadales bacterium]|jgi:signal transduction histidine kinase